MKNNMLTTIIIAIVVGAVAFFGGMQYQKSKAPTFAGFGTGQNGQRQRQFGGNRNGQVPIIGQIISSDAASLTIKQQDGSTKIVLFSETTKITKTETGVKTDLKKDANIAAFGTTNSDGSITAQNIQLNPVFRMGQNRPNPTR